MQVSDRPRPAPRCVSRGLTARCLSHASPAEEDVDAADVSRVPAGVLRDVEADTYWCMSRLLDGIQVSPCRPGTAAPAPRPGSRAALPPAPVPSVAAATLHSPPFCSRAHASSAGLTGRGRARALAPASGDGSGSRVRCRAPGGTALPSPAESGPRTRPALLLCCP